MKLTFSTLACPDWPLERIIAVAAENGLGGIDFRGVGAEIDITKLLAFTVHLPQTLEALRQAKLAMPCVNTSVTLLSPDSNRWEAMLEECHRFAQLAAAAKMPFLRVFGGSTPPGMHRQEALLLARRRLRQIIKICRAQGVRALVETHDDWCTAVEMLTLLEESDATEVGVLWDLEHAFRHGEKPLDTALRLGKFLAHVHIKDSVRVGDRNVPKLLGEGELPLKECMKALESVGYDGWICLETEKRWHADAPEPQKSIPQFAAYMRQFSGLVL